MILTRMIRNFLCNKKWLDSILEICYLNLYSYLADKYELKYLYLLNPISIDLISGVLSILRDDNPSCDRVSGGCLADAPVGP